jgi:hypothetical protein
MANHHDGAAAASNTYSPGSEGLRFESASSHSSMGGNGSYISAQQHGGMQQHSAGHVQHPSTSGDVPPGPANGSSQVHPAYSAALTNATSTASSLPLAVDESPGWGADQGRGRPSLDLDQQNPHVSKRPPLEALQT